MEKKWQTATFWSSVHRETLEDRETTGCMGLWLLILGQHTAIWQIWISDFRRGALYLLLGCGAFELHDQDSLGSSLESSGPGITEAVQWGGLLPPVLSFQLSSSAFVIEGSTSCSVCKIRELGYKPVAGSITSTFMVGEAPALPSKKRGWRARRVFIYGPCFKAISPDQFP